MRHNDARKWLHAGLDLLPLILIPVFMVYSHRHIIDGGSISVPYNKIVDFNQQIDIYNNPNFTKVNSYTINFDDVTLSNYNGVAFPDTNNNDIYYLKYQFDNSYNGILYTYVYLNIDDASPTYFGLNNNELVTFRGRMPSNNEFYTITGQGTDNDKYNGYAYLNLFNLTQMFGAGNEPTIQQFDDWYSNGYYAYTLSHKELLKGYSEVTYDDNDIMSQFTYQLYNSVDKYFNMGNVFNLGGVYDWFNLNIFSGNAPIALYIVWNIVLYEFVMDLLFLLYGLFMWFIDMMKHIMEKPFRAIK